MDRYSSRDHCSTTFSASAVEHDQHDRGPQFSTRAQTVGLFTRLLRFCHVLVMLIVGLLVVSCSGDSRDGTVERVGVEVPAVDLTATVHASTRELLEQQVGIERSRLIAEMITDHVDLMYPYVKYRTYAVESAEEERRLRDLDVVGMSDDERQDTIFDGVVKLVLYDADDTRSGDIAAGSGRMYDAYVAGVEECASDLGITSFDDMIRPSVEDLPSGMTEEYSEEEYVEEYSEEYADDVRRMFEQVRRSAEEFDQFAESLGFTRDELLDLRHSCSRYAATLPSLDPGVREDLFRLLHEHYLSAVQVLLAENPQATEPVEPALG